MIEIKHIVEVKHEYRAYFNEELIAIFTVVPREDVLEFHSDVKLLTPRMFRLMKKKLDECREVWRAEGYRRLVAPIPVSDMTDRLRKFRALWGFKFETVVYGYNCAVMEV